MTHPDPPGSIRGAAIQGGLLGREYLRERLAKARLCVITDRSLAGGRSSIRTVMDALDGGVPMVQVREKSLPDEVFLHLAREMRNLTRQAGALFIVNDRPDLAAAVDADGVHLGQRDMSVEEARRLVGPDRLVGLSVENLQQALDSKSRDIDYLGVGPVFSTPTKTDAAPPTGLGIFRQMREQGVRLPAYAIGGIGIANAPEVLRSGAWGLAVISAIVTAPEPIKATQDLMAIIKKNPFPA